MPISNLMNTHTSDEAMKPDGRVGMVPREPARVADLMTRPDPIVPSHISMAGARKIAQLKSVEALVVEDQGCLVGILDRQSLRAARDDQRVAECVSALRFFLTPSTTVEQAHAHLIRCCARSLPVVAGGFLVGSISRSVVERSLDARIDDVPASARMAA